MSSVVQGSKVKTLLENSGYLPLLLLLCGFPLGHARGDVLGLSKNTKVAYCVARTLRACPVEGFIVDKFCCAHATCDTVISHRLVVNSPLNRMTWRAKKVCLWLNYLLWSLSDWVMQSEIFSFLELFYLIYEIVPVCNESLQAFILGFVKSFSWHLNLASSAFDYGESTIQKMMVCNVFVLDMSTTLTRDNNLSASLSDMPDIVLILELCLAFRGPCTAQEHPVKYWSCICM